MHCKGLILAWPFSTNMAGQATLLIQSRCPLHLSSTTWKIRLVGGATRRANRGHSSWLITTLTPSKAMASSMAFLLARTLNGLMVTTCSTPRPLIRGSKGMWVVLSPMASVFTPGCG